MTEELFKAIVKHDGGLSGTLRTFAADWKQPQVALLLAFQDNRKANDALKAIQAHYALQHKPEWTAHLSIEKTAPNELRASATTQNGNALLEKLAEKLRKQARD